MVEIDVEAVRDTIAKAVNNDEVWYLVGTYRVGGRGGDVTVEIWHTPEFGYSCRSRDEDGDQATGGHADDAVTAVGLGHLHRYQRSVE